MMNKFMKKLAVALTAATMALTATSLTASAYTQYVSNDIGLNVRAQPSKSSASLGGLNRGDAVDVICDAGNGWVKINYNGKTAYVRNCLSDIRPSQNTGSTWQSAGEYTGSYTVSVPSGYLALRSTPCWTDDDSNVIEAMYSGQHFTLSEKCGQYWYGYSNSTGAWGYVNADYLY